MIFMPQTLWGIFYYVNLIEIWGERVSGRRRRGSGKVQMCKGGKVKRKNKGTSGRVDWWNGKGRGHWRGSGKVQMCKGGKV